MPLKLVVFFDTSKVSCIILHKSKLLLTSWSGPVFLNSSRFTINFSSWTILTIFSLHWNSALNKECLWHTVCLCDFNACDFLYDQNTPSKYYMIIENKIPVDEAHFNLENL